MRQLHDADNFFFDLFGRAVEVRVILSEAANAHQSVENTGALVAVHCSQLSQPQRKFSITARCCFIDQNAARAVHRFDGKRVFIYFGKVHVFMVVVPVPRAHPEGTIQHQRGLDLLIAAERVFPAPKINEVVHDNHSLGVEEGESRSLRLHAEQIQLFPQLAVVAQFCLLHAVQVCL